MSGIVAVYDTLQVDADLARLKLVELVMLPALLHGRSRLAAS